MKILVRIRKLLLVSGALLTWSAAVSAGTIACDVQKVVVNQGVSTFADYVCSPGLGSDAGSADDNVAGDGLGVYQIRLRTSGALSDSNGTPGFNFSVAFNTSNVANSPAFTFVPLVVSATVDANRLASNTGFIFTNYLAIVPIDVVPSFTVRVTGAPGSTPLPFNASSAVSYEVSAAPEPGTLALFGSALVGLGFAARRRK